MGVMGGFMQPQGHLQVFLALAQGLDPQSALELPRFCIEDGTAGGEVALEEGIPAQTVADLDGSRASGPGSDRMGVGRCSAAGRSSCAIRRPGTLAVGLIRVRMAVR